MPVLRIVSGKLFMHDDAPSERPPPSGLMRRGIRFLIVIGNEAIHDDVRARSLQQARDLSTVAAAAYGVWRDSFQTLH
jgi:hypothetical protein